MSLSKKAALAAAATLSVSGMGASAHAASAQSPVNMARPAVSLSVDQHGRALVNHETVATDRISTAMVSRWHLPNFFCGRNGHCR